jgi:hypothetical protein
MSNIFILFAMMFLHIMDDYVLQAFCLSDLKQKSFWEKNAPQTMYKHDYIVALIMHAFSWSFMIMLPIALINGFDVGHAFFFTLLGNTVIHAVVDDLKANRKLINLWIDQMIHLIQINITISLFFIGVL